MGPDPSRRASMILAFAGKCEKNKKTVVSACCAWAACWAVRFAQEAARSGGEELMGYFMGAQGGSRGVGMWEGAAMRVVDLSKRMVSGRQACCVWAACWAVRCAQEAARRVGEV